MGFIFCTRRTFTFYKISIGVIIDCYSESILIYMIILDIMLIINDSNKDDGNNGKE